VPLRRERRRDSWRHCAATCSHPPFMGSIGGKRVEGHVQLRLGYAPGGASSVALSISRAACGGISASLRLDIPIPSAYTKLTIEYALQGSRVSSAERRPHRCLDPSNLTWIMPA